MLENWPETTEASKRQDYAFIRDSVGNIESVHVFGDVDFSSAPELEETLELIPLSADAMIVDFTACRYFDSSTITVLIRARKRWNRRFAMVVPEGSGKRRILQICCMEETLLVQPDISAAIQSFQLRPNDSPMPG